MKGYYFFVMLVILGACVNQEQESKNVVSIEDSTGELAFASDNGSITLPHGFKAIVVATNLGNARHIAVRDNGDVYINLGAERSGGGLVALRDKNKDGKADQVEYFGKGGGTGIGLYQNHLYYSTNTEVFRVPFKGNELVPSGQQELMLTLPEQRQHAARSLAFDNVGNMYVNIGAPSNSCQSPDRVKGVPGQDPCPLLSTTGGIWKFDAHTPNQTQKNGTRYATGIRNAVGICWNKNLGKLYAMQHGRDQLFDHWPKHFNRQQSTELPAEEMFEVEQGDDFGWPYCYYDWQKEKKLLNPEYGGDGNTTGRCSDKKDPVLAFPGHWAPNGIVFYEGDQFPEVYKHGAFVAFHGSWNRAPNPQKGYKVVFAPYQNGQPTGSYQTFADGFANNGGPIEAPGDAIFRPCGLTVGPNGSLYICDSVTGRVWRVVYTG